MNTTEISSTRKAMFSMEAYCPSQDCNPHESICAKPRIEFICATHCANPTCGVRAFGVGQMLCRQVVDLQLGVSVTYRKHHTLRVTNMSANRIACSIPIKKRGRVASDQRSRQRLQQESLSTADVSSH